MDRLVLAAVVGFHPFRGLGIEDRLKRELTQPRLDITGSGSSVSRQDITPVSLAIDQQVLLTQLHQGITDGGIAMRVVLHGLTDDVGYLVVLAVIDRLHRMQDTALHRLQTIFDRRHCTLQYHVRSIVQEPVLVHACQMILHRIIETTLGRHPLLSLLIDENIG